MPNQSEPMSKIERLNRRILKLDEENQFLKKKLLKLEPEFSLRRELFFEDGGYEGPYCDDCQYLSGLNCKFGHKKSFRPPGDMDANNGWFGWYRLEPPLWLIPCGDFKVTED